MHPKQTVTLPDTPGKVKENGNMTVTRAARWPALATRFAVGLQAGGLAMGIGLALGGCAPPSPAGAAGAAATHVAATAVAATSGVDSLVVLHTNDVHSHLDPFLVA